MAKRFKGKRKFSYTKTLKFILIIFIVFIIYQIFEFIFLSIKLTNSNETFINYILEDTNYYSYYEKKNKNIIYKVINALSDKTINSPINLLESNFKYKSNQDNTTKVVTLVTKEHQEGNVDVEEEYVVLGVTILGNGVAPAVAGANIKTLAELDELRSNMAENILKAASYIGEEEPKNEPKNNSEKGVKKLTYLNRKQLQELGVKFPGYKAIGGAKDENGIRLCLMAKDGSTAIYTMETENDTIAPEKLCRVNALATFQFNEECNLEVDVCEMTDALSADLAEANENLEKTCKELSEAKATIEAMRKAENARRLLAAKAAAKAELADFNANRAVPVEESILDAINADIDAGMYTERVNASGEWVGEAEVINRVKAACADAQKALDKQNAQKNETTFVWDRVNKKNSAAGGNDFDSMLSRMGKSLKN